MKKLFILLTLFIFTNNVYAEELKEEIKPNKKVVEYINCTSSSNIWLSFEKEYKRISLIAYDKEDGSYNKEIDNYICNSLKNATKIEVEYDPKKTAVDNYNREEVWVYIDGKLLQKDLISRGYGQVNFIKDKYNYLDELCSTQKIAISEKLGIWNYEGIKESYCKSGIKVGEKIKEEKEEQTEEKKYDFKTLYFILLIDAGIVILVLILRSKRIEYEN